MNICVFGAASVLIEKKYIERTEALCERLARAGHSLVFGAGAGGLMGAAARGFKRGGGHIHGVIPTFFREAGVEAIYDECDELTYTETMSERKAVMENAADAFITVPGGIGTFEEFFEVLTLKQLGRHEKAMALYNIDGYYDDLQLFMNTVTEKKFVPAACRELYLFTDSAEAIIDYLDNYTPPSTPWIRMKKDD